MTVKDLIARLEKLLREEGGNPTIDVLIEVNDPSPSQYQFPANDVAYSASTKSIIIMHEKWTGK